MLCQCDVWGFVCCVIVMYGDFLLTEVVIRIVSTTWMSSNTSSTTRWRSTALCQYSMLTSTFSLKLYFIFETFPLRLLLSVSACVSVIACMYVHVCMDIYFSGCRCYVLTVRNARLVSSGRTQLRRGLTSALTWPIKYV